MIAVLPIIKGAAGLASSLGAGAVVGNAIKATTPTDLKLAQKILVGIGGVALSSIAGERAAAYIENQIQAVADGVKLGKAQAAAAAEAASAPAKEAAAKAKEAAEDVLREDQEGNSDK